MRLEASQSGMYKYLFKEMPPHWAAMFNSCGVKYTSWHLENDSNRRGLRELKCDGYDYEFKNEGLTFYDQTTTDHTFENDLFSLRYSIEFFVPLIHFGYNFGK